MFLTVGSDRVISETREESFGFRLGSVLSHGEEMRKSGGSGHGVGGMEKNGIGRRGKKFPVESEVVSRDSKAI